MRMASFQPVPNRFPAGSVRREGVAALLVSVPRSAGVSLDARPRVAPPVTAPTFSFAGFHRTEPGVVLFQGTDLPRGTFSAAPAWGLLM
jgi:hypothetical protein